MDLLGQTLINPINVFYSRPRYHENLFKRDKFCTIGCGQRCFGWRFRLVPKFRTYVSIFDKVRTTTVTYSDAVYSIHGRLKWSWSKYMLILFVGKVGRAK